MTVRRHKRKILLVDDDPGILRLLGMTLGSELFELLYAADGAEALRLAQLERPDLILLDVNIPGPSGFEVCRALKSNPATSHLRIVMLTADGSARALALGRTVGADEYFVKPFSPRALLEKAYEILLP